MIKVEHANKTFSGKYGKVHALQDVSIHVEKGDIYGTSHLRALVPTLISFLELFKCT